jgi:argininosuccinate lyase
VEEFQNALAATAEKNPYIMPGYTHMQHAQVVTMKYYLMAYHAMFGRDKKRLFNALDVMDECPLGCGALAGTTHDMDRAFSAQQLGFSAPYANFLDGVSDRDFCVETMSVFAVIMMHLSRLAEELVLWNSAEFGFITLDDKYTTGSSIMPQKKNPDAAELVRGNCGKVYGDLVTLLTVMKGLPLAYNKDMQNDKVSWHDSMLTTSMSVAITARMVGTMVCHPEKMRDTVKKGFMNATEVADYLVKKGVPFRDAHGIVGEIVLYCEDRHKPIEELSLDELLKFDPNFTADIFEYVDYDHILHKGIKKEML